MQKYTSIEGSFNRRNPCNPRRYIAKDTISNLTHSQSRSGAWLLERIGSASSARDASEPSMSDLPPVTWTGSLWQYPRSNDISANDHVIATLKHATTTRDASCLRSTRGDFVAATIVNGCALLVRSLEASTTPLFYTTNETVVHWSTNIKDLMPDPIQDLELGPLALMAAGENYFPFPSISILPVGHCLILTENQHSMVAYDSWPPPLDLRDEPIDTISSMIREALLNSLDIRLRNSSSVGLMLSGGIDSSSLAWALAELGVESHNFTWVAPNFRPAQEGPYALAVSQHLHQKFTGIDISKDYVSGFQLIDPEWRFSFPYPHVSFPWMKRLVDSASPSIDTLIWGHGGDGVFANGLPPRMLDLPRHLNFFEGLWTLLQAFALPIPTRTLVLGKEPVSIHDRRRELLRCEYYTSAAREAVFDTLDISEPNKTFLHSFALKTNLLNPSGIQLCEPYLDKSLMQIQKSLPPAYFHVPYGGVRVPKPMLRAAMLGRLPGTIVNRDWATNVDALLQLHLVNNVDQYRSILGHGSILAELGIIDSVRLDGLLDSDTDTRTHMFSILINALTELWLRSLDR